MLFADLTGQEWVLIILAAGGAVSGLVLQSVTLVLTYLSKEAAAARQERAIQRNTATNEKLDAVHTVANGLSGRLGDAREAKGKADEKVAQRDRDDHLKADDK